MMICSSNYIISFARIFLATRKQWSDIQGEFLAVAVDRQRPFLVEEAKELRLGPVVVVDVLRKSEHTAETDELRHADYVIRPHLKGISALDFKKRTEAAYQGQAAVTKSLAELKQLVGMQAD